jgi:conjugal transfer pilus assembly protein TraF
MQKARAGHITVVPMKSLLTSFSILLCLQVSAARAESWWGRSIWSNPQRSELWYPPAQQPQAKTTETPKAAQQQMQEVPGEVTLMAEIKAKLEELRTVAIIHPTPDNVKNYVRFQEEQAQRASVFADAWRRALWESPELLYQGRPTNAAGVQSFDAAYNTKVRGSIAELSATHGVYFFFRSDCPYCHAMVPTINALQAQFGIHVIAVSLDGKAIRGLDHVIDDAGQAQMLGVASVPAFYLADLHSKSVQALGTGVMSLTDLEDRIYTQAFTAVGAKF